MIRMRVYVLVYHGVGVRMTGTSAGVCVRACRVWRHVRVMVVGLMCRG